MEMHEKVVERIQYASKAPLFVFHHRHPIWVKATSSSLPTTPQFLLSSEKIASSIRKEGKVSPPSPSRHKGVCEWPWGLCRPFFREEGREDEPDLN